MIRSYKKNNLQLGIPAVNSLNLIDCEVDEECKPIRECSRELKLLNEKKLHLIKFCGIWLKSVRTNYGLVETFNETKMLII